MTDYEAYSATCPECYKPFTPTEWELRHGRPGDGEDIHQACCERLGCPADREETGT